MTVTNVAQLYSVHIKQLRVDACLFFRFITNSTFSRVETSAEPRSISSRKKEITETGAAFHHRQRRHQLNFIRNIIPIQYVFPQSINSLKRPRPGRGEQYSVRLKRIADSAPVSCFRSTIIGHVETSPRSDHVQEAARHWYELSKKRSRSKKEWTMTGS